MRSGVKTAQFWAKFKTVYLQKPRLLRPRCSRSCCTYMRLFIQCHTMAIWYLCFAIEFEISKLTSLTQWLWIFSGQAFTSHVLNIIWTYCRYMNMAARLFLFHGYSLVQNNGAAHLINFWLFFLPTDLIRNCSFINFAKKFLPARLFRTKNSLF